ncbi:hypothetical protein [Paraclostridium dentum]|uniref:hypothetical protein n=1 Tax=Paraclostridium dentum TaxID=2662455 RepID=UPI003F394FAB
MDGVSILGVSQNYIPKSSSYTMEVFDLEIEVDNNIDYLTKVSCCCNATFECGFEAVGANYTSIFVNFDVRVDYIYNNKDVGFHLFNFDKFIYINSKTPFNKHFNLDCEIIDLDIISIDKNKIYFYIVVLSCIY